MATRRRGPYLPSAGFALALGAGCLVGAAFCFRDAYERRGRQRPPLVSYLGV